MRKPKVEQRDTRQEIAEAFCARVRTMPLSKVRIAELIEEVGVNRNTFYYYFSSKYDVAAYVFRHDLDKRLRRKYTQCEMLVNAGDDDPFSGLAFYAATETAARRLNDDEFVHALFSCVLQDGELYRNLFTYREMEFIQYVQGLLTLAYTQVIDFMLGNRHLDAEVKGFLAAYNASALIGLTVEVIGHPSWYERMRDAETNPLINYPLDSIHHALNNCLAINRSRFTAQEYGLR